MTEQSASWWGGTSHSGAEQVIVEYIVERTHHSNNQSQFWNLPQYRPYKLGLLGAGYALSYSKKGEKSS